MSSTDDRIVRMQFDNAQFKKGAAETQKSLSDLDRATAAAGKSRGLMDLASGMSTVAAGASKMAIITTTALATIANKVTNVGLQLASSLTLDPIKAGFSEYESLLSKQAVIMNATGKSATAVKKVLNDLNHYSDKTIFSFADMTEGLTSFVNAGVPLKQASQAMKGIANASALAGASTQEAQSSFRAFGQALGQGFLGLQDYRQAAITGKIGTVGFKQSLIDAAVAAGTLTKRGDEYITKSGKAITATKGFDLSLQEQWANTKVLNSALRAYGDQSTALGKKAFKSAQDVRTFSAFMDTLKESLGSGWAQIFTTLIGGLDQSTKFFTGLSNTIGKQVNAFFNFANAAIVGFKALGGFNVVLQGLKNIIAPFAAIFRAVGDALAIAFPGKGPGSGEVLFSMAKAFEFMTRPLAWLATQIPKLVPVLVAFFTIIKLGVTDAKAAAAYIGQLADSLGEMLNIKAPSGSGFGGFFDVIIGGLQKLGSLGGEAISFLFKGMISAVSSIDWSTVGILAGAGLLGGIYVQFKKFTSGGGFLGSFKGILGNVSESFDALTGSLKALQTNIQSKTLMNIGIAIALVAASMVAMSLIPPDNMSNAVTGLVTAMGILLGGMAILTKISKSAGFIQMPLIAASLVLLAGALTLMTGAIALMSLLSYEQIKKGLLGIAGALVVIAAGMKIMPSNLPITAAGLVLVGLALGGIAGALAIMGNLEWGTIGKGLVAMAGSLLAIAGAMQLMPPTLPITAAGLVLVGIALTGVAGALKIMGGMSWEAIGKGLVTLGGALALLAIGLNAMNGTLAGSAALAIAAVGIDILTPALIAMSKLSWKAIAKGMVALAGGLAILAVAMYAMSGAVVGAAALLIVAPAITLLAGALILLSTLSWEQLGVALVALAATLGLIAAAGLLLAPAVPAILALGAALVVLGAGLALAGAGIFLMATGLGLLVQLGGSGIAALGQVIGQFIAAIPGVAVALANALIQMIAIIGKNAPMIGKAIVSLLTALITAAEQILPKLAVLFGQILDTLLRLIVASVPKIAKAAVQLVIGLLNGLASKVGDLVKAGTNLIVKLIEGIASMAGKIATAAAKAILDFINALDKALVTYEPQIVESFLNLGKDLVAGLVKGIGKAAADGIGAIGNLANDMINKAKDVFKIFSPSRVFRQIGMFVAKGLTLGVADNASAAIRAVASMVGGQIAVANEYVSKFIQDLDQKTIAARGKADGLAAAANSAQAAAKKTKKNKKDDKAANQLAAQAKAADRAATVAQARADAAKAAQDRKDQFDKSSLLGKAQMRSEDAQNQLDAAKAAEQRAAKDLAQANALDKQSKVAGVTPAQRKKFQADADKLRAQAAKEAKSANDHLDAAKGAAADALAYQKKAGDEAAAAFDEAFKADAQAAEDAAKFDKLTDAEKAKARREQAAALQKKADEDLASAKKLAYTDLEAANQLAQIAQDEAKQARDYIDQATSLEASANKTPTASGGGVLGTVVNLDPTDAAALAMQAYQALYDTSVAAAAGDRTIEFNQYNTSPEALDPSTLYRQSNNLFADAVSKIEEAAAA